MSEREAIARIIDPHHWGLLKGDLYQKWGYRAGPAMQEALDLSLSKADAILAHLSAAPSPVDGGEGSSNASPSPLDAARHSSNETGAPSGPHAPGCPAGKAWHGAVGIECEHGFDVCGICDRCTCAPFQARVEPWMRTCFGDVIPFDKEERGDRLVEEVYELLQWAGYDRRRLAPLEGYVWGRPIGEGPQEVGGVMVTLAAFCLAHKLDMHEAGETELARIWTKVEQIRAKQAAKPTGSALPLASPLPLPEPGEGNAAQSQPSDRRADALSVGLDAEPSGVWLAALKEIVNLHAINQPPELNMPEAAYARLVIREIHRVAWSALEAS